MGPSLGTASALDRIIKEAVVMESLHLAAAPSIAPRRAEESVASYGAKVHAAREAHDAAAPRALAGAGATAPVVLGYERVLPPAAESDPRRRRRYAELACFDPDVVVAPGGSADPRRAAQAKARAAAREQMRQQMWQRKQDLAAAQAGAEGAADAAGATPSVVAK
jgi:hypothetical protein